ncbi:MAG: cadherin-like beta sandwich domain-containing protein [Nitrospira sp.]|nr:cadherin-like beta sandwich domain-containing protein [Nitrospira sp.]
MTRMLTFTGSCWSAVLVVAIGVSSYGCKDSASVSDVPQVPLSSLAVTPGSLQPAFSSTTANYTVDAPTAATSVTVTAAPQDSTTTMTINGVSTAAGQGRSVPLGSPGSTATIRIVLSSQTGGEGTYTVTVTRLLSSDNNLSALSVTPGSLAPSFASDTLTYTVDVATTVTSVNVSATKSDPNAVLAGSVTAAAGVPTGQATIVLDGPGTSKMLSLTVTAPNGSSKTYGVTVHRAASDNNNLSALTVTPGALAPGFAPRTLTYQVNVETKVTSVAVSATKSDPNAVLSGSITDPGTGQATGQATIQLGGPGTTTQIAITVTAQNGSSKTYTITVNRAAPSSDNNLSALNVTPGTLAPAFAASTLTYTMDVATNVTEVTVAATKSDPDAVMSGSLTAGTGVATGRATLPLSGPGTTTQVSIIVTAPNGNSKTYMITVNRLAPSTDSNLSNLTVSAGSLMPAFAPGMTAYSVDVSATDETITVTATKSDPNAVMSASGSVIAAAGTPTGQVTVPLGSGTITSVTISITAQDGISTKAYTIAVNRPAR